MEIKLRYVTGLNEDAPYPTGWKNCAEKMLQAICEADRAPTLGSFMAGCADRHRLVEVALKAARLEEDRPQEVRLQVGDMIRLKWDHTGLVKEEGVVAEVLGDRIYYRCTKSTHKDVMVGAISCRASKNVRVYRINAGDPPAGIEAEAGSSKLKE